MEICRTGLNNAESLLNEKENYLKECLESLNNEKMLNTNLTNKYDMLHTQYETEKDIYVLQNSQLNEKVILLKVILDIMNCILIKIYILLDSEVTS